MNERIREVREALGYSQRDFAARIGVTASAISRIENGERPITERTIIAICSEFSISGEWLKDGSGTMFNPSEDELISQIAVEYNLDALSQDILSLYVKLPGKYRVLVKSYAQKLLEAASIEGLLRSDKIEAAQEITAIRDKAHDAVNSYNDEIELARSILDAQATIDERHNKKGGAKLSS